jgi:hypothetical protein
MLQFHMSSAIPMKCLKESCSEASSQHKNFQTVEAMVNRSPAQGATDSDAKSLAEKLAEIQV